MTQCALGIDLGGTHVRLAVISSSGVVQSEGIRRLVPSESGEFFAVIAAIAIRLKQIYPVQAIGLAMPGLIDSGSGMLKRAVNLPFLEGHFVGDQVARRVGLPVVQSSDADASTWSEYLHSLREETAHCNGTLPQHMDHAQVDGSLRRPEPAGAPESEFQGRRFLHMRFGTGIGLGFVDRDRITALEPGRSGHLDMLRCDESSGAETCRCGATGCLDLYASGYALRLAVEGCGLADISQLQSAADAGVAQPAEILSSVRRRIRASVGRVTAVLKPDRIRFGGGVIQYLPKLAHCVCADARSDATGVDVDLAALGDNAGVIGAALLAMQGANSRGPNH